MPREKEGKTALLFVDDAAIIVTDKDFTETHQKLTSIMERDGGIFEWAHTHNCEFGVDKFQLLDFTRKMIPHQFLQNRRTQTP